MFVTNTDIITIDTKIVRRLLSMMIIALLHIKWRIVMREIKRNDIYYADLDPIKGSEQGGVRPVVIIQNDVGNKNSPTTIIAAVTSSQSKSKLPTHISVKADCLPKDSIILLEQIRTIDKLRLINYIGTLDDFYSLKIRRALMVSLAI